MSKANRKFVGKSGNCEIEIIQESAVSPTERNPVVLALVIYENFQYFGCDPSRAIPHLRDDHKMSFEQLEIGMSEIGLPFNVWQQFYWV